MKWGVCLLVGCLSSAGAFAPASLGLGSLLSPSKRGAVSEWRSPRRLQPLRAIKLQGSSVTNAKSAPGQSSDPSGKTAPCFRFVSPKEAVSPPVEASEATKPLALFLPGLKDGGSSAHSQFADLSRLFELRVAELEGGARARPSFAEMADCVAAFLLDWDAQGVGGVGKALVIGEGFGGMLALGVSLRAQRALQGAVAVNPSTSWERSNLYKALRSEPLSSFMATMDSLNASVPLLASSINTLVPEPFVRVDKRISDFGWGLLAAPLVLAQSLDDKQKAKMTDDTLSRLRGLLQSPGEANTLFDEVMDTVNHLVDEYDAESFKYKVKALNEGVKDVNPRLGEIKIPVFVLAGEQDQVLPSQEEALRLTQEIAYSDKKILYGCGHLPLDSRVNITKFIEKSIVAHPGIRKDNVLDYERPPKAVFDEAEELLNTFRRLTSPVFFSTDPGTGKVAQNLKGLPKRAPGRPVLFVGNHQMWGLDTMLMMEGMYKQCGDIPRGLAHPYFMGEGLVLGFDRSNGRNPLEEFGAVAVSPKNMHKLLKASEAVLLYPGGQYEAFHGKGDEYKLFWPKDGEFVRLAARFNAIIVPFSGVGCSDIGDILEGENGELTKSKILQGESVGEGFDPVTIFRGILGGDEALRRAAQGFGTPGLNEDRLSFARPPPLFIPKALWDFPRFYYKFGVPIDTKDVDSKDREQCGEVYSAVKQSVQEGIDYLLHKRKEDPYQLSKDRFAIELQTGCQAPTFDP